MHKLWRPLCEHSQGNWKWRSRSSQKPLYPREVSTICYRTESCAAQWCSINEPWVDQMVYKLNMLLTGGGEIARRTHWEFLEFPVLLNLHFLLMHFVELPVLLNYLCCWIASFCQQPLQPHTSPCSPTSSGNLPFDNSSSKCCHNLFSICDLRLFILDIHCSNFNGHFQWYCDRWWRW